MRNKTQERVEELARERAADGDRSLALVEEGIELGKKMMAEMIATTRQRARARSASAGAAGARTSQRTVRSRRHCGAQSKAQVVPAVSSGYLNEASALTVPSKSGELIASGDRLAEVRRGDSMASYRFCRTDDIALLVDALNRCWSPYFPDQPAMTPATFKRSIRDLQVWCSSCMVAFAGADPIGVLIGAKRPSGTLVHKIAVHPDHRRQGHGRHLLTSLGSKLAILGPPRIVAEVPETLDAAPRLFKASGYVQEAVLTDYVLRAGRPTASARAAGAT